jgi:hypothetical protein
MIDFLTIYSKDNKPLADQLIAKYVDTPNAFAGCCSRAPVFDAGEEEIARHRRQNALDSRRAGEVLCTVITFDFQVTAGYDRS